MYICEVWRIEYMLLNMYRFEILRLQLLGSPQTSGGWHHQCFELGPLHTFSSVCWQLGCPLLRNSCSSLLMTFCWVVSVTLGCLCASNLSNMLIWTQEEDRVPDSVTRLWLHLSLPERLVTLWS